MAEQYETDGVGMRPSEPTHVVEAATEANMGALQALLRAGGPSRGWTLAPELPLSALDAVAGCTRLQVQLLHNRGVRGAEAQAFLSSEWRSAAAGHVQPLRDLARGVVRIQRAIANEEQVVVFGDYDCDGVTSCALLYLALLALGARVEAYIPQREDDGRGLNLGSVQSLAEKGTRLIITTDCGASNVEEIALAQSLGVDVIVTDHHPQHGPAAQPYALINPQRADDTSSNKDLAGVGVAFRLAEALLLEEGCSPAQRGKRLATLEGLLDLVVVGAIADVAPLSPENWSLARAGLRRLNSAPRPGLLALIRLANLTPGEISARDISFAIAPRINSGGRLGQPMLALRLLIAQEAAEVEALARELDALNMQRQALTEAILHDALAQTQTQTRHALVAIGDDWPLGIIGLIAGRLSETFHRPAFVISRGATESRGSGRAPMGYNLGAALATRPEFFRRFGGHAQAAGFTLNNDDLDAFLAHLHRQFEQAIAGPSEPPLEGQDAQSSGAEGETSDALYERGGEGHESRAEERWQVDCRLPLKRIAPDICTAIQGLAPYGPRFAEPIFLCEKVRLMRCWRSGPNGRNLRIALRQGSTERVALWTRQGELADALRELLPTAPLMDMVFTLDAYRNRYDGSLEPLARILALEPAR